MFIEFHFDREKKTIAYVKNSQRGNDKKMREKKVAFCITNLAWESVVCFRNHGIFSDAAQGVQGSISRAPRSS